MRQLIVGQESLQFQKGVFFQELTMLVAEMKKVPKNKLDDCEQLGQMTRLIKHHTGLGVAIEMSAFGPAVDIPALNKNHPLVNQFIRNAVPSADGLRMIAQAGGMVRGTVNLKTGKVTGVFEEMGSTMYMPYDMFTGNAFSPEEIAATQLHELGHLFSYCEYMSRSASTNQALAGLVKGLEEANTVEEREVVLVGVKKALELKELDTKALAQSTDKRAIEVVVVSNIATSIEDEIGANIYNFNTWEYLSDQYAARQGAGRYVVTALDKIYRASWNISFRSTPAYLTMEALKAGLFVSTIFIAAMGAWGAGYVAQLFMLLVAMDGMGDGTYDRPGARMKRVRNQIVEALKLRHLTEEEAQRYTEDLQAIDEVLARVHDREQWVGLVWNLFSKNSRKRLSQEALAKELEGFASNDLFVHAAKLKLTAAHI
jgi:hypothetical protein